MILLVPFNSLCVSKSREVHSIAKFADGILTAHRRCDIDIEAYNIIDKQTLTTRYPIFLSLYRQYTRVIAALHFYDKYVKYYR